MKYLVFCLISVCGLFLAPITVFAQAPAQVAVNRDLADDAAGSGDILSISANGLVRSSTDYDNQIFGVVVEAPIISVEPKSDSTRAVASTGTAQVKVSSIGGNIAVGDFITTSTEAGVGKKATESGYVLGKALSAYEGSGSGDIQVAIEIGYQQLGAEDGQGGLVGFLSEPGRLRLVLSTLLAILVLIAGVISFLRVVNTGVGAIGRNPLARPVIIRGMVISGSVVFALVGAGLAVSVAIIFLGS